MVTNGQTMTPVLMVQEATVQTVNVSIHTLRVGKKQVTMGMFRQVPTECLLDWWAMPRVLEGAHAHELWRGVPWGRVNYWWEGAHEPDQAYLSEAGNWLPHGEKIHVLWQKGEYLLRTVICERMPLWIRQQLLDDYECPEVALNCLWRDQWKVLCALPQLFIAV